MITTPCPWSLSACRNNSVAHFDIIVSASAASDLPLLPGGLRTGPLPPEPHPNLASNSFGEQKFTHSKCVNSHLSPDLKNAVNHQSVNILQQYYPKTSHISFFGFTHFSIRSDTTSDCLNLPEHLRRVRVQLQIPALPAHPRRDRSGPLALKQKRIRLLVRGQRQLTRIPVHMSPVQHIRILNYILRFALRATSVLSHDRKAYRPFNPPVDYKSAGFLESVPLCRENKRDAFIETKAALEAPRIVKPKRMNAP